MSADFLKVKLADLCTDVSYGYTASSISESVGPKFLRITDIQGGTVDWASVPYCEASESAKRKNKLERGDIVIARTGNSTGENYIFESNEDTVFASYLIRFRVNPALANPYFVWLQLRTQAWWDYVSGSKSGSAQAGANAKVLGCYKLNLPGREVQNKIELIFRKLNEKIQVNLQINQTLEQMAQAIFKSWFVDFEPVKAKIAALEAGGSEDDALLAAMQDSELGEIPEGWECLSLDEVAHYQNGLALQKYRPENEDDFLPVLKIAQLRAGYADGKEKASPNIRKDCIVDNGDVIFSWSGSLIVDIWCGGKAALNQHLFKV